MKQLAFVTIDQFELLQACGYTLKINRGRVYANLAQWDAFTKLPENIQEALAGVVIQKKHTDAEKEKIEGRKRKEVEYECEKEMGEKEMLRRLQLEAAEKRRKNNKN